MAEGFSSELVLFLDVDSGLIFSVVGQADLRRTRRPVPTRVDGFALFEATSKRPDPFHRLEEFGRRWILGKGWRTMTPWAYSTSRSDQQADLEKVVMAKRALRREIKARLARLDETARVQESESLWERFAEANPLGEEGPILAYLSSFPEEPSTWEFVRGLWQRGIAVALPRVDPEAHRLALHRINSPECLVVNRWGIAEPAADAIELRPHEIRGVLTPGLAFDRRGGRLGRGGGYYDRLLSCLDPRVPRWAVAFSAQIVEQVPTLPHDQTLHGVVTAQGVLASQS